VFITFALFMGSSLLFKKSKDKEPVIDETKGTAPVVVHPESINKAPVEIETAKPVKRKVLKNKNTLEYEEMIARSAKYHPFYKVKLTVSGYASDRHFKTVYFSAQQNGQNVFNLDSNDLLLAGYELRVLTACSVRIKYHDFEDFIVCSKPSHEMGVGTGNVIASNL